MTTMEDQLQCFYLDSSSQNASDMLRKCVQDRNSELDFNCKDDPMKQELYNEVKDTARMNNISIQRGITNNRLVEDLQGKYLLRMKDLVKHRFLKDNVQRDIVDVKKQVNVFRSA